jgi:hypothetical protein
VSRGELDLRGTERWYMEAQKDIAAIFYKYLKFDL